MIYKHEATFFEEERKTNYCLPLTLWHIKRVDTNFLKTDDTMYFSFLSEASVLSLLIRFPLAMKCQMKDIVRSLNNIIYYIDYYYYKQFDPIGQENLEGVYEISYITEKGDLNFYLSMIGKKLGIRKD